MAKSFIVSTGTFAQGDNTTRYYPLGGKIDGNAARTTEAEAEVPIRDAGTFSNLFVNVPTNTASVSSVITFRKSQTATSITLTYTADQTGIKEDTSNTASFAATDEADYEVVIPTEAGTNNLTVTTLAVQFEPTTTTDTIQKSTNATNANVAFASGTRYTTISGNNAFNASAVNFKVRAQQAMTIKDFYVYLSANARTTDTVFGVRINGSADANQQVTYTAGQTGAKEATGTAASVSAGDDYDSYCTTLAGTEILTVVTRSATLVSTGGYFHMVAAGGTEAVSFNTTANFGVQSNIDQVVTESHIQVYPRFTFTASHLGAFVSVNTIATSDTTVFVRDNGSNGTLTFSYTAGQTGLKTDAVNTDTITSGTDEINYQVVTPNTSGSLSFTWIGVYGSTVVAGGDTFTDWPTFQSSGFWSWRF